MSDITNCFACYGCTKKEEMLANNIKEEGKIGNLIYIVYNSNIKIPLEKVDLKNEELVNMINSSDFVDKFIPKFGKYEIELFIADQLRKAIFITNDLSDLFYTSIIVNDVYSQCLVSPFTIQKELISKCLIKCKEMDSKNIISYRLKFNS